MAMSEQPTQPSPDRVDTPDAFVQRGEVTYYTLCNDFRRMCPLSRRLAARVATCCGLWPWCPSPFPSAPRVAVSFALDVPDDSDNDTCDETPPRLPLASQRSKGGGAALLAGLLAHGERQQRQRTPPPALRPNPATPPGSPVQPKPRSSSSSLKARLLVARERRTSQLLCAGARPTPHAAAAPSPAPSVASLPALTSTVRVLLQLAALQASPAAARSLRRALVAHVKVAAANARDGGRPFSVAAAVQEALPGLRAAVLLLAQGNAASPLAPALAPPPPPSAFPEPAEAPAAPSSIANPTAALEAALGLAAAEVQLGTLALSSCSSTADTLHGNSHSSSLHMDALLAQELATAFAVNQ
jgi:hypothetical protein